jgi:ankyrin repeat protein
MASSVLYSARPSSTDARFACLKRLGISSGLLLSSELESFLPWNGNIRSQTERKMILLFKETKQSKDSGGRTPLWCALRKGHEAVVKLLLKKGAELESKDDSGGWTPLWLAAGNGHEAVVKLLLKKGAELESKEDSGGRTPLSLAAGNGHEAVVKLLLEKGAELESKDSGGRTPL